VGSSTTWSSGALAYALRVVHLGHPLVESSMGVLVGAALFLAIVGFPVEPSPGRIPRAKAR
jgi:hypothetical protein